MTLEENWIWKPQLLGRTSGELQSHRIPWREADSQTQDRFFWYWHLKFTKQVLYKLPSYNNKSVCFLDHQIRTGRDGWDHLVSVPSRDKFLSFNKKYPHPHPLPVSVKCFQGRMVTTEETLLLVNYTLFWVSLLSFTISCLPSKASQSEPNSLSIGWLCPLGLYRQLRCQPPGSFN